MIPVRVECGQDAAYLYACFVDCVARGEAPFSVSAYASGLDMLAGIEAALDAAHAWAALARRVVVYTDLGISMRMAQTIREARAKELSVEFRSLPAFGRYPQRPVENPFAGFTEVP